MAVVVWFEMITVESRLTENCSLSIDSPAYDPEMFRVFALAFAFCLSINAYGQDASLTLLRRTVLPMRNHKRENLDVRGATSDLTVVKHQLRDWIESHLHRFRTNADANGVEHQLNEDLKNARVTLDDDAAGQYGENLLGSLGDVELYLQSDPSFLLVKTRVGILCGFDESAYIYQWNQNHWQRRWESERNTYTKDHYNPQTILEVLISPAHDGNRSGELDGHLILTLGKNPWCASNWQPVYYRVWRVSARKSTLLLDQSEYAFEAELIHGSVTFDDVVVEFRVGSIDGAVHNRAAVGHYKMRGDKLERVGPVALSPRDFVDEWLTHFWTESLAWSESSSRAVLSDWHKKLNTDHVSGEFLAPTMHCTTIPDLWQVGVEFNVEKSPEDIYFIVRWKPPYSFTMVGISTKETKDCIEEDRAADSDRTLFPNRR